MIRKCKCYQPQLPSVLVSSDYRGQLQAPHGSAGGEHPQGFRLCLSGCDFPSYPEHKTSQESANKILTLVGYLFPVAYGCFVSDPQSRLYLLTVMRARDSESTRHALRWASRKRRAQLGWQRLRSLGAQLCPVGGFLGPPLFLSGPLIPCVAPHGPLEPGSQASRGTAPGTAGVGAVAARLASGWTSETAPHSSC